MPFLVRMQMHQKERERNLNNLREQLARERALKEEKEANFMPKTNKSFRSPKSGHASRSMERQSQYTSPNISTILKSSMLASPRVKLS